LGGCCGASPAHIAALSAALPDATMQRPDAAGTLFVASTRRVVNLTPGGGLCLVGERINPSGKAAFSEDLRRGSTEAALELAQAQCAAGVHALDINVGVGGIDEAALLCAVIDDLALAVQTPLFVDSTDPDAMEAALRRYAGRAACNSIALGPNTERLLAACRRYGALPVLMPLEGWSLPADAAGRHAILDRLLLLAQEYGFGSGDVLVDCATPCLAMGSPAQPAVDFVAELRARGIATVAGVSNISFRMPRRGTLNRAYLCQLAAAGLSAAIVNPTAALRLTAAACDALRGADEYAVSYIRQARGN
jgi:5-methyltetrahydrofolate--homocysteine methyltransferase